MGVTTQYLRFVPGSIFGSVTNNEGQAIFVDVSGVKDRYVACTSCENVILWDLKTKQILTVCRGEKSEALRLCLLGGGLLAVGYADGAVKIFSFEDGSLKVTLQGHKAAVSCMRVDPTGSKLVTGAKDGVIIVWDIVNESGLYRLKGHKGPITQVRFLSELVLVSSSKDTFVKFWDMDTQHCFHTLVGHRNEIWDFVLIAGKWLVTGTSGQDLNVWQLEFLTLDGQQNETYEQAKKIRQELDEDNQDDDNDEDSLLKCRRLGTILRQGKGRTCGMCFDETSDIFSCFGQDNQLELFTLLDDAEIRRKHAKRLKKELKRKADDDEVEVNQAVTVSDLFRRLHVIACKGKLSSVDVVALRGQKFRILAALKNNSLDSIDVALDDAKDPGTLKETLRPLGHRSDVRTLCFTSDNAGILSASGEQLKLWSAESSQCIRSLDCEYALCCGFLLGDRHCVIGTKTGKLQLFDLAGGELMETIDAHNGSCWSLSFAPDKKSLVTGGSDKVVKFWNVEINKETKKFTLKNSKRLELPEEILSIKISPNNQLLACALADNTIKVFFVDTLKFFLSLYGHQYPVLCMDISHDSTLLISGSSDRNVKIWGLDFGDCHKSLFAHSDSVMQVQFLPKSHQFFSVGKDKMVKHWDADNFQRVLTLTGHQAEVWALSVSSNGNHVVTAGHDKSIRLWDKTEEPLILEEQREIEREEEAEKEIDTEESVIPREGEEEVASAGKKSLVTIKCAERLMEAIEVFQKEAEKELDAKRTKTKQAPPHSLLMLYRTSCRFRYILEELKRITAAEMNETLMVLPFNQVLVLMEILIELVDRDWEVELMSRTLFFLIRIHSGQILATTAAVRLVNRAQKVFKDHITGLVDEVALNMQALTFIKQEIEERNGESFFADATETARSKKKKAKKIQGQAVVVSVQ